MEAFGRAHREETKLKQTGFFLMIGALAASAIPGLAGAITVPDATMLTSLTSCEVQTCGANPHTLTYNGLFSGYSTQTVGEGAFISVSGTPFPVLTANVPTEGANADINAQLTYFFEVVPIAETQPKRPCYWGSTRPGPTR
jgi:hypothetical protein